MSPGSESRNLKNIEGVPDGGCVAKKDSLSEINGWVELTCERCKSQFYVRAARVYDDSVHPLSCSACRQALGHKTAVRWG